MVAQSWVETSTRANCPGSFGRRRRPLGIRGHHDDGPSRLVEELVTEILEQSVQQPGRAFVSDDDQVRFFATSVVEQRANWLVIGDHRPVRRSGRTKWFAPFIQSSTRLLHGTFRVPEHADSGRRRYRRLGDERRSGGMEGDDLAVFSRSCGGPAQGGGRRQGTVNSYENPSEIHGVSLPRSCSSPPGPVPGVSELIHGRQPPPRGRRDHDGRTDRALTDPPWLGLRMTSGQYR